MKPIVYWSMIAILGTLHLHAIVAHLPILVLIILATILILLLIFLHQKRLFFISELENRWNGLLFVIQLFVILINFNLHTIWLHLITFAIFICIEWFRHSLSNQIAQQRKQITYFKTEIDQMNETFRVVRSERHDFLKHISALHFMLEKESYSDAHSYLNQLVDGYKETNLSIKGERGTVAGILHQMYRKAKSEGIEAIYNIDVPISTLPLSDQDITALLGNLLSNSIEACETWQAERQKQATLTLEFYKRSGLFLIIIQNNSLPIPNHILDNLYDSYGLTTKSEDHEGLGTKIIKDVVNDYMGYLDFEYKNEEFTVKIKIPAIH